MIVKIIIHKQQHSFSIKAKVQEIWRGQMFVDFPAHDSKIQIAGADNIKCVLISGSLRHPFVCKETFYFSNKLPFSWQIKG